MIRGTTLVSALGAGILVTGVFSNALAAHPSPHDLVQTAAKNYTVNGRLTVTDVLRVQKNISVFGHFYAKNREEVSGGLLVRSGGLKTDSLEVTAGTKLQDATVAGNLQAGTVTSLGGLAGSTLNVTGAATLGSTLAATGKITGNGLDGGAGGVTTTGPITTTGSLTAGAVLASSLSDTGDLSAAGTVSAGKITTGGSLTAAGALAAGSVTTTGTLTAGAATLNSLAVTGNVDLSKATVTGLSLNNLAGGGALSASSLALGSTSSNTAPLTLNANGKSALLGVDTNGALTLSSAVLSGNLSVAGILSAASGPLTIGSGGLAVSSISGAPTANTTAAGPLTLTGSTLSLNGPVTIAGAQTVNGATVLNGSTTIGNGGDLTFSIGPANTAGTAGHFNAGGNADVAGVVNLPLGPNSSNSTVTKAGQPATVVVPFARAFTTMPIVTLTPTTDPLLNSTPTQPDAYWVTPLGSAGAYTGFTIHYRLPVDVSQPSGVTFNYHVIGS